MREFFRKLIQGIKDLFDPPVYEYEKFVAESDPVFCAAEKHIDEETGEVTYTPYSYRDEGMKMSLKYPIPYHARMLLLKIAEVVHCSLEDNLMKIALGSFRKYPGFNLGLQLVAQGAQAILVLLTVEIEKAIIGRNVRQPMEAKVMKIRINTTPLLNQFYKPDIPFVKEQFRR